MHLYFAGVQDWVQQLFLRHSPCHECVWFCPLHVRSLKESCYWLSESINLDYIILVRYVFLTGFFSLSFVCFLSRALMLVLSLGVCIFGRKCLSWFFVCVPSSIHLFVNTRIAAFGIQDVLRCLQRSLSFLSMYYDVCQYLYVTNSPVRATRCLPITVLAFFLFFFFIHVHPYLQLSATDAYFQLQRLFSSCVMR